MRILSSLLIVLSISIFSFAQNKQEKAISFLHTNGQDIVNESGQKILLKGVGTGRIYVEVWN